MYVFLCIMCICVCVYVFVYVCLYVFVYVCKSVCVRVCVYVFMCQVISRQGIGINRWGHGESEGALLKCPGCSPAALPASVSLSSQICLPKRRGCLRNGAR